MLVTKGFNCCFCHHDSFYEIFWLDLLVDNMLTNNISEHNMFSDIKSVFFANVSSS